MGNPVGIHAKSMGNPFRITWESIQNQSEIHSKAFENPFETNSTSIGNPCYSLVQWSHVIRYSHANHSSHVIHWRQVTRWTDPPLLKRYKWNPRKTWCSICASNLASTESIHLLLLSRHDPSYTWVRRCPIIFKNELVKIRWSLACGSTAKREKIWPSVCARDLVSKNPLFSYCCPNATPLKPE